MVLARWQATIVDEAGNVLPGASVTVRAETSGNPLANLFSDRAGVVPTGNPITADGEGFAFFYIEGGAYRITATLGLFSREWRYVGIGTASENDSEAFQLATGPNLFTSYLDLNEIATPIDPPVNTARVYAVDDGLGITRLRVKDSAGNIGSLGGREILYANRTYYVRTDGNNSNTGLVDSAAGAFLTLDRARQAIYALDLNGFTATVDIGNGTYTAGVTCTGMPPGWDDASPIIFTGDTTTPANVIISTTSAHCFAAQDDACIYVEGVEMRTTTGGDCLLAARGSTVRHGNVRFGVCAAFHKETTDYGKMYNSGNYTISGNAVAHQHVTGGSYQLMSSATVTLSGTPAFSSFFLGVNGGYSQYVALVFSGAATGPRFLIHQNGVVQTDGANIDTYFPGNVVGTSAGGAMFDDFEGNMFLRVGAAITWGASDVAISHAANQLFFAGAASGYQFDNTILSTAGGILSSLGGIGYTTGAGGAVTQLTNKTTGVTLNKTCGDITMASGSIAANGTGGTGTATFVLTNSTIGALDHVVATHNAGGSSPGAYKITCRTNGAGSTNVDVRNVSTGALDEAIVIRFTVIKGTTS